MHPTRAISVLIGLIIHTFFDGIAIASGFLVSNWLGWIIFLAVFLHKIPEGFTVASVMLASGRSRSIAWGASVLLGAATLAGVLTMAALTPSGELRTAAGGRSDHLRGRVRPDARSNQEPGVRMALVVFLGVGFFPAGPFVRVH